MPAECEFTLYLFEMRVLGRLWFIEAGVRGGHWTPESYDTGSDFSDAGCRGPGKLSLRQALTVNTQKAEVSLEKNPGGGHGKTVSSDTVA